MNVDNYRLTLDPWQLKEKVQVGPWLMLYLARSTHPLNTFYQPTLDNTPHQRNLSTHP